MKFCCMLMFCRQSKDNAWPFCVPGLTITSFHLGQLRSSLRVRLPRLHPNWVQQAVRLAAACLRVALPQW